MKPPAFAYRRPDSVEHVLSELSEHGSDAVLLAGGQSLIPLLNLRLSRPEVVIDLGHVAGLDDVLVDDHAVSVGALVRARAIERSAAVAAANPVVVTAIRQVAHPQIRNRTTIGGNIAHADPSSELPAVLAALDGSVRLRSQRGERDVVWSDYFQTVFTTSREPDELLVEVVFPRRAGWNYTFMEVARRQGDYPLAGLCVGVREVDGVIAEARLAAIGVADRPVRLSTIEAELQGVSSGDQAAITEIGRLVSSDVQPMDDLHGTSAYRVGLLGTLVRRTLNELTQVAA